jgi:Glycosyl hydrolases family 2, TIM barrel domain/Glycosyl hydrolases family 2, sugar binding domain
MIDSFHPTPLLERSTWWNLNGPWGFAYDDSRTLTSTTVSFERDIMVPYAPESKASGIGDTGFHACVWYQKVLTLTPEQQPTAGQRLLLHFGAVDYSAEVWANRQAVAQHKGGHTPFVADVTDTLAGGNSLEILVRAEDDPLDMAKPRGKQDWQLEPHEIWYPRTTGIWQTVWLELVPETRITGVIWTPHADVWALGLEISLSGPLRPNMFLHVRLSADETEIANDRYSVNAAEIARRIALPDPGIDDYRNDLLWSPGHPQLIDAQIELWEKPGDQEAVLIDKVSSYTAMRSVGVVGNRFMLNGRPYYLKMVLDQGYWEDSLLSATDAQLKRDVELAKQLGFNGIRKHQKIEDPRWFYWCDRIGMLVWAEMPSPYRFTTRAVERLVAEWTEAIYRDYSHPCIVAWVPLNESWGVPDLPTNTAHRNYVRALYHLTKTLDPSRPVVGNDGWEHIATDIISVHDYEADPAIILERYRTLESSLVALERVRPGGRAITLEGFELKDYPVILSEFGGIAYIPEGEAGWGYSRAKNADEFLDQYASLLGAVDNCRGLAGFCYTQLIDTFQEKNGILDIQRKPKAPLRQLFKATRGARNPREMDVDPNPDLYDYSKRWKQRRRQ